MIFSSSIRESSLMPSKVGKHRQQRVSILFRVVKIAISGAKNNHVTKKKKKNREYKPNFFLSKFQSQFYTM